MSASPHSQRSRGPTDGGLSATILVCAVCGSTRPPYLDPRCGRCGGSLRAVLDRPLQMPGNAAGFWDYAPVLPVGERRVSLGEGATPLLKLDRLFPHDQVYVKAEWTNATGSFKDRGSAVAVSVALALGAEGVVCASTGNNAASVSACVCTRRAALHRRACQRHPAEQADPGQGAWRDRAGGRGQFQRCLPRGRAHPGAELPLGQPDLHLSLNP